MTRSFSRHRMPATAWLLAAVAILSLGFWAHGAAAQQSSSELDVVQIRPNFYMIAGAGGNIGMQLGSAGVILVDSGSAGTSNQVLAAVRSVTNQHIRYIINTSADPDHVGGNGAVSKAGLTILSGSAANPGISEDVLNNGGAASVLAHDNVLARMSAPTGRQAPFPFAMWPTKTFTAPIYAMYLNGEGIQVIHQPAAHTDGDTIVFFRRADVIATGDIVDMTRFPFIDVAKGGSVQGEIDALNRLMDMSIANLPLQWEPDRTLLVPGHGRVFDKIDLLEYRDMVTVVRDRVRELIKEGKTLEQVKAADPTLGFRSRYGSDSGSWTTTQFVDVVYRSLAEKK